MKEKIAMKIFEKNYLSKINNKEFKEDLTSMRWEIDISKLFTRIDHDNITKIKHVYESLEFAYIVMEYASM